MVDSKAVFKSRITTLGMASLMPFLEGKGWDTQASFAFATGFGANGPDEVKFTQDVVVPILETADRKWVASLRRFHYECFMMTTHDLAQRTTKTDEDLDKPIKLPGAERVARLQRVKDSAPGVDFSGVLEPSCKLVDRLVAMQGSGHLKIVQWSELTRRDYEIQGLKSEEHWKVDANNNLKRIEASVEDPADTSSDLKLQQALTRRGVALDMADLMSFQVHETLVKFYFSEMDKEPIFGYNPVSLQQIHRADIEAFTQLAGLHDGNLQLLADGSRPLDKNMKRVMKHQRFTSLLAPLLKGQGQQPQGKRSRGSDDGELLAAAPTKQQKKAKAAGKGKAPGQQSGAGSSGKGKKKGIGKNKIPAELVNLPMANSSEKLCFAYNLEGCGNADGKCQRGAHKCYKCGKSGHSQRECKA